MLSDTSKDALRLQVRLWQRMSSLEKAQAVSQISRNVRELSLLGIQRRYPGASERECRLRYALLTLGRPLACRAYSEAGAVAGR